MAEFENGYCTGCGYKTRRWGLRWPHRPYCWRKVTMMLSVDATEVRRDRLLKEMAKHWRWRSVFLCRPQHMYYPIPRGFAVTPPPPPRERKTEGER